MTVKCEVFYTDDDGEEFVREHTEFGEVDISGTAATALHRCLKAIGYRDIDGFRITGGNLRDSREKREQADTGEKPEGFSWESPYYPI